ncbi:uncharacterized protein BJ212DRAFT_1375553, partial [Suillus subaureus]
SVPSLFYDYDFSLPPDAERACTHSRTLRTRSLFHLVCYMVRPRLVSSCLFMPYDTYDIMIHDNIPSSLSYDTPIPLFLLSLCLMPFFLCLIPLSLPLYALCQLFFYILCLYATLYENKT